MNQFLLLTKISNLFLLVDLRTLIFNLIYLMRLISERYTAKYHSYPIELYVGRCNMKSSKLISRKIFKELCCKSVVFLFSQWNCTSLIWKLIDKSTLFTFGIQHTTKGLLGCQHNQSAEAVFTAMFVKK